MVHYFFKQVTNLFCLYPAWWVDAYIFTFDYNKTKQKKNQEGQRLQKYLLQMFDQKC